MDCIAINLNTKFISSEKIQCQCCQSSTVNNSDIYENEECQHMFCSPYLSHYIMQLMNQHKIIKCPVKTCDSLISQSLIKAVLSTEKYKEFLDYKIDMAIEINKYRMYRCPNLDCRTVIVIDAKPIHERNFFARLFFNSNNSRMIQCPKCLINFCDSCKRYPFHQGYTCEKYATTYVTLFCFICQTKFIDSNTKGKRVCHNIKCIKKYTNRCTKILKCGHHCMGTEGEQICIGCSESDCCRKLNAQNFDELCSICMIKPLMRYPCIKLKCNHVFHKSCIDRQISMKYPTSNISFKFCTCPLCSQWISHPLLTDLISPFENLQKQIQKKALNKLKTDHPPTELKLLKTTKKIKDLAFYALSVYNYYECSKCQKPYFGGKRQCQRNAIEEDVSKIILCCPDCASESQLKKCLIHGDRFMQYKCRYCCSLAIYFCWGTTHFCEKCHEKQISGEYLSKKPIEEFKLCDGPKSCPLRINHPHIEEYIIGCAQCKIDNF